ncbi:DEAD/DEAH box helicase [Thiomicrorhabdus lithotrophica]|uniref:DEAD/DEAH box helicase n=1 Tax=Thiomicrorhabdus lithotrophica TaxID=2949997 RepID=A0ABY8CCM6_9GAMM|nr:SNF2-related protein [Thiomicrorhabdus lithotrophica]WEJ61878.1 DEAD/DEAH box helicase [Thiomicrorhabdus lithotrophica]
MNSHQLTLNSKEGKFLLTGAIESIIDDRRLSFSLKKLGGELNEGFVSVPYDEDEKVEVIDELTSLLAEYNFIVELSADAKKDIESYNREINTFQEFTEKARLIRDNAFGNNEELVEDFKKFKDVLSRDMVRSLYPIQLLSAFHMAFAQNACNFAVPGAGKTSIVYGAYTYLKSLPNDNPKHVDKLMVIGPLSAFAPWENEYLECYGCNPSIQRISGDVVKSERLQHLYSGNPAEITIITHAGVEPLIEAITDYLKRHKTMIVVDEAHRIKSQYGVAANSIMEISKEAASRIILTGTPVPNGYEDLFNLYKFIYPHKHMEVLKFHRHNLKDMTKNSDTDSARVLQFKKNISPYFIRIKKKDLGLASPIEHIVEVDMDAYQREIYDYIESKYIKLFQENGAATVHDVLNKAKLIRLRQASTNPSLLLKPLKDALEHNYLLDEVDPNVRYTEGINEYLDDSEIFTKIESFANRVPVKFSKIKSLIVDRVFPSDGKVIIWTIFIQNAKQLQEFLLAENISSKLLIGEVAQDEREQTIEKFNDPSNMDFQVVIANPFSVSESISLHKGCHNAIYMERDYNCSMFLQSKDRIHRYGLPDGQETHYYYVVSTNSIDGVINKRLAIKAERMSKIIDDDIPLFARIDDEDESDLVKALMEDYARRS